MHRSPVGGLRARRIPRLQLVPAVALLLVASAARAQDTALAPPSAVIRGKVVDGLGNGIAGAHVSVGGIAVPTDSVGAFELRGLPRGPVTVAVHRLGFAPLSARAVADAEPRPLELRIHEIGALLAPVRVQARLEAYDRRLAGFYARKAQKLGYYITREDIAQRNDYNLTSALRRVPGVRVYTMRGALGRSVHLAGARCDPLVFVNGFPASLGSFDLDMIDLQGIEGVEIYPHGSRVPSEFAGSFGTETCGVIAIWTAPQRGRESDANEPETQDVSAQVASGSVYLPTQVDQPARYVAGSAQPAYPDSLLRAGIGGRAIAQFVVDTTGRVESGTVEIVSASSPLFASAVRAAIGDARFAPARLRGTAVRALVSLPFDFDPRAEAPGNSPDGPPDNPGARTRTATPPKDTELRGTETARGGCLGWAPSQP